MAFYRVRKLKHQIEKYLTQQERWSSDASSRRMYVIAYYQVLSSLQLSKRVFRHYGKPIKVLLKATHRLSNALYTNFSLLGGEDDDDLVKEIHLFAQTMHEMEEEFADQLYNPLPGGGGEEDEVDSSEDTKMIGFSNQYQQLKRMMLTQLLKLRIHSLTGMPGIGKTTLAREVFRDPEIMKCFDCRVWVRVGRNCGFNEMLRRILVEMGVEEDEDVVGSLHRSLKSKRYLIVLDDVWDKYGAASFQEGVYTCRGNKSQLRYPFPDDDNGSILLVISRLERELSHYTSTDEEKEGEEMKMELMDREESWHLFYEKVFGQERCPPQLETFGRKIVEKCEGHPLTIVTVANLLSREEKTVEYWSEVATKKRHQLFKAAYDEMYKVLLPSYNHLPPCLQKCFMYIGMFPQDYDIPRSKLINFWTIDGFLELVINQQRLSPDVEVECLQELVSNSMVMIKLASTNSSKYFGDTEIKTCKLHSCLRYLSKREGRSSKFCYVLDSTDDVVGEDIKAQPRLSFHNNVLFAIKDVNESVEDNCASTAHSLFCYGPYLQYQVPICFGLRLLKKLDALGIRFYEFPLEVLQLVELRYLALTLNGNLPAAISQLLKLQFLIVHPHERIKFCKGSCYLPMEIWNMQELRHLEVPGKKLPNPRGALLENLSTLARVSHNSCTLDVLKGLPILEKLGIEVDSDNDGDPFRLSCLAHVERFKQLATLKCVAINRTLSYSFPPLSSFPRYLKKLTLDGLGFAWEEMDKIGCMGHLYTLKLRNYAFQGPTWEVREQQFPNLYSLIIEDTDLERWRIGKKDFTVKDLVIKRSYKLKEIYGKFIILNKVEIVDCNPVGIKQLKEAISPSATLTIRCSWYDKNLK